MYIYICKYIGAASSSTNRGKELSYYVSTDLRVQCRGEERMVYIYLYIYVYIYINCFMYIYINCFMYIYVYIYIDTDTYIHT
jgi:hypothetical protein